MLLVVVVVVIPKQQQNNDENSQQTNTQFDNEPARQTSKIHLFQLLDFPCPAGSRLAVKSSANNNTTLEWCLHSALGPNKDQTSESNQNASAPELRVGLIISFQSCWFCASRLLLEIIIMIAQGPGGPQLTCPR